jgi:hypothetical protein
VLLDFKYTETRASCKRCDVGDDSKPPRFMTLSLLSKWQLEGYRIDARDDVYRLIFQTANALSRGRLVSGIERIGSSSKPFDERLETWRSFHQSEPMFIRSSRFESEALIGSNLDLETASDIQHELEELAKYAREFQFGENLDYNFVEMEIDTIQASLNRIS